MKKSAKKIGKVLFLVLFCICIGLKAEGCTSALIGAEKGQDGRWILWKHRDSGHPDNYVRSFPAIEARAATDSTAAIPAQLAYVALFNSSDVDAREAWIGFNEAGFAVMNTATYNIPAPRKGWEDREGLVMTEALRKCRSLVDFYQLLTMMPLPRGVQANFGAFDAEGHGAYFETDDYGCCVYPLDSLTARHLGVELPTSVVEPGTGGETSVRYDTGAGGGYPHIDGILMRTNFSFSGGARKRLGMSRYYAECHLLDSLLVNSRMQGACPPMGESSSPTGVIAAEDLIETVSRSLWFPAGGEKYDPATFPIEGVDLLEGDSSTAADRGEVISRRSSCASVAIEGPLPGEDAAKTMIMWTAIGFPTLSTAEAVTLDSVPEGLQGHLSAKDHKRHSSMCDSVNVLRNKAFLPAPKGSKAKYLFNLDYLRREIPMRRQFSLPRYRQAREALRSRTVR